jgi:hypothetical protein
MASAYAVITVANLEARSTRDYSSYPSAYTDAQLEANISQAERDVLSYCGSVTLITEPAVVGAVTELAYRLMENILIDRGEVDADAAKRWEKPFDDYIKEGLGDLRAIYGNKRKLWIGCVESW